ncbi:TetR/AcrR family transcriptional regulator [Micromonospora echinofusca]|uniref:TetR family transcriptional regulator n=1 Tax=Micromonospora echinofusca TaxID=47858 RepID=A0ABS3VNV3_MICEH|nr:helix-turn-helix domain-containing protein [Micromonospora echinofusca]MBO4206228.1 TetR family transcriptional regulator [Micromonospora echinofusca]
MPLPRFHRLPATEQERILAVATRQFSVRGLADLSVHEVADEAGLSRSAMYNYFDGRGDLVDAVRAAALRRVAAALGAWVAQPDPAAFWAAFRAGTQQLSALLAEAPELRPVLATATGGGLDEWVDAFFGNAVTLGLVSAPHRLTRVATGAILAATDAAELAEPGSVSTADVEALLRAVWCAFPQVDDPAD